VLLAWLVLLALPCAMRASDTVAPKASDAAMTEAKQAVLAALASPTNLNMPAAEATNRHVTVSTNDFNVLDDKYRLQIGDQVSFQIIEDEEDPKVLVVTDSGDLQVPYIGRYAAVGKTCKELAAALKVELEKDYYKQATVVVAVDSKPRSRGKVYLVGAIRAPGAEEISSDETLTVSKAILRAGGFAEFANQKEVHITRDTGAGATNKTNIVVNVAQIFEKGKIENDVVLRPGDLIFVPERLIRF
jgi:protein involved in polysaccharide export with SLBB domain